MPPEKKRGIAWKKQYTELFNYSTVGIEMGACVGIGVGIGYYIDVKWLGGKGGPWIELIFLGLGIAAAVKAFMRALKEMRASQAKKNKEAGEKIGGQDDGA